MRIDIRLYQPGKETRQILNALFEKDIQLERVRREVYEYKRRILSENYWNNSSEVEQYAGIGVKVEEHVVTDPEHIFLLSGENLRLFKELCFKEAKQRGYKVFNPDDCPILQCDEQRARLKDRLVSRLIIELEEQRLLSLRNLRAVSQKEYTNQVENLVKDLLSETGRIRKVRDLKLAEVERRNQIERVAI